jgi:hypothetical protein
MLLATGLGGSERMGWIKNARLGLAAVALSVASAPAPAMAGTQITGKWHGVYVCAEDSEMWLELWQDGRKIWGIFRFRTASGTTGSYRVSGWKSMVGEFGLEGIQWIDQPEGFRMVGMKGEVNMRGDKMNGFINDTGCGDFYLERDK